MSNVQIMGLIFFFYTSTPCPLVPSSSIVLSHNILPGFLLANKPPPLSCLIDNRQTYLILDSTYERQCDICHSKSGLFYLKLWFPVPLVNLKMT